MAGSSVRPVATDGQPEPVEATAPPPVSGSYATAVGNRPGRCTRSSVSLKIAKGVSRSAGDKPDGLGYPGRRAVPVLNLLVDAAPLGWNAAPGMGSGRDTGSNTRKRLGLDRDRRRLATPRARRPVAGRISSQPADGCPAIQRDQLRTAERCPTGEGLNTPTRWTGPETKGYINSACSGPRCLQRAYVKSAAAAFPLGDLRESESSLRSDPGSRETPPGFYGGKPWKSQITIQLSPTPGPLHSPLEAPPRKTVTKTCQEFTEGPSSPSGD